MARLTGNSSISAPSSVKPLKVTDSAMHSLLTHHNVGTQFLDLLLSCSKKNGDLDAGGSMTTKHHADGSYGEH